MLLPPKRNNFRQLLGGRVKRFNNRLDGVYKFEPRYHQRTGRGDQRERAIMEADAAETMAASAEIAKKKRQKRSPTRKVRLVDVFIVGRKTGPLPQPLLKGYVMGDGLGNRYFVEA